MAVVSRRKASSLSSGFLLFTALLATFDVVAADDGEGGRACDDLIINIVNDTDINFYKTCPVIDGVLFFVDHMFQGPFDLPGVESLPSLSSGYLLPEIKGLESDRVDDAVTTFSMPDLQKIEGGNILFGYLNHLTSVDLPKLETVTKDVVVIGSDGVKNITWPALSTVGGGMLLDGDFDEINLPSLKSVRYIRVESISGNISCPALGAAFASLTFNPEEYDPYEGFTCWTPYEDNRWNSSDPENNPTTGDSSPSSTSSGSASGSTSGTSDSASAASVARVGYAAIILLFSTAIVYL